MKFRTALRLVTVVGIMMAFLLLTIASYPAIVQDKEAPEGLTGGQAVQATTDKLEGTWSAFHVHKGNPGGWKHAGTFTITKYAGSDGLKVKFTSGNGGGDAPKAENEVKFSGNAVILYRAISPPFTDPETGSQESSQTWRGRLLEDRNGLKIEGKVFGAGMALEMRQKNATTFLAIKQ